MTSHTLAINAQYIDSSSNEAHVTYERPMTIIFASGLYPAGKTNQTISMTNR